MLFDLKGRRRRVVQVTYIGLALLMGGGLVLSGIGSDASGGLLDAFVGSDGDEGDARKPFEQQIDDANRRLATSPRDREALATLVRANFGLAGLETVEQGGQVVDYNDKGKELLRRADAAWGRYLDTDPRRIDSGLAATAIQIYNVIGPPEETERWVRPAREIAQQENSPDAYVNLFTVATRAGDTRTAGLAERKALSLTESKDERATIKERIDSLKEAASGAPGAGGNGAAPQGP
jgi:hypothetical protein